ncbi:MAG: hypothetical protein LCH96_06220, partial [Actinobacteria bacterium]|nr:hypothetical protein [Actinomycetota bacterium]
MLASSFGDDSGWVARLAELTFRLAEPAPLALDTCPVVSVDERRTGSAGGWSAFVGGVLGLLGLLGSGALVDSVVALSLTVAVDAESCDDQGRLVGRVGVGIGFGVWVGDGFGVGATVGVVVAEGSVVAVAVSVGVTVAVGVPVGSSVGVTVAVGVTVGVSVVGVSVGVGVTVGVSVGVGVTVGVSVGVGVTVGV